MTTRTPPRGGGGGGGGGGQGGGRDGGRGGDVHIAVFWAWGAQETQGTKDPKNGFLGPKYYNIHGNPILGSLDL